MGPVLVTGARGRLGAALSAFLSRAGEKVKAVSREDIDLGQKDNVAEIVERISPSLIFHTAAMTNVDACEREPEQAYRDNYEATRNLAEAAAHMNVRFIHFSTDYVFDGTKASPYVETDFPNPLSVYARTKLQAERAVGSLVEDHVIIRVAWLFGAKGDFVSFVRQTIEENLPLKLATDHCGSPGYIPDLIPAICEIASCNVRGIFHLTNSGDCTRFEMGREIIRLLGADVEPGAATGAEIGFAAPRPAQSILSCAKYERTFGKTLRSWREALRAYLANPG